MPQRRITSSLTAARFPGSGNAVSFGTLIHGSPRRMVIATPPAVPFTRAVSRPASAVALAMTRVALTEGHDVIVPQFLARPAFIGELENLAANLPARFIEIVLLNDPDQIIERLAQRAANPTTPLSPRSAPGTPGYAACPG